MKRSLKRWRRPPNNQYQEPPGSPSEAETRGEFDKLRKQVKSNRRLLWALAMAVILRGLWTGESEALAELIRALLP